MAYLWNNLGVTSLRDLFLLQYTGRCADAAGFKNAIEACITSALKEGWSARDWVFTHPVLDLTCIAPVTGTCTGVYAAPSTTITAVTGTFPSTCVGYLLVGGSGTSYRITTYTASTTIVVSGDAHLETSWELEPPYVLLPTTVVSVRAPKGGLEVWDGSTFEGRLCHIIPGLWAEERERAGTDAGLPKYYTIRSRTTGSVTRAVVELSPPPDDAYTIVGLHTTVCAPDISFATTPGGTDDYSYLPKQLDRLLVATARYQLVTTGGLQNVSAEERAAAAAEYRVAKEESALFVDLMVESLDPSTFSVYPDRGELASTGDETSTDEDRFWRT